MNGSKALSVMLLLLAATIPSVAESSTLPDYRKDAKKVHLRECDSSTTHVTMYRSATYYVTAAIVGAIQFPPLCKGRRGGVEASRGWASRERRGWCKPARCLPPHPLPPTVTIGGRGLPWEPPTSFQAPTRFPEEPYF